MFLNKERKITETINGIEVEFRYPTIQDEIQIEARKQVITRGQYMSMGISPLASSQNALDLTDALSTLTIIARFPNNPDYNWEFLSDEEGTEFALKCFEYFKKWRLSFRKGNGETDKRKSEGDSKE